MKMDTPAFENRLEESDWLRRLARHLVDDPQEAEDVAHETWLAAARHGEMASRGWLATVGE